MTLDYSSGYQPAVSELLGGSQNLPGSSWKNISKGVFLVLKIYMIKAISNLVSLP
jgi:hypothetical protein